MTSIQMQKLTYLKQIKQTSTMYLFDFMLLFGAIDITTSAILCKRKRIFDINILCDAYRLTYNYKTLTIINFLINYKTLINVCMLVGCFIYVSSICIYQVHRKLLLVWLSSHVDSVINKGILNLFVENLLKILLYMLVI